MAELCSNEVGVYRWKPYRPRAGTELACEIHGPLRQRPDGAWGCAGFDGEGCLNLPRGLPGESAPRLLAGQTCWPGVLVLGQ